MNRIDCVIVSDGRSPELINMTQCCIDSFHHTCQGKVICVEKQMIGYKGAVSIPQSEPFCYNRCLNEGYRLTATDWVCFANNDCVFLDGWDEIINQGYDSVSPRNPNWFLHNSAPESGVLEGYDVGQHVCGWCIVVRRTVLDQIGGFPEDVDFFYSDNLYADVLRYYGIKHALVTHCKVQHKPSTTLYGSKDFQYYVGSVQEEKYQKAKQKWT